VPFNGGFRPSGAKSSAWRAQGPSTAKRLRVRSSMQIRIRSVEDGRRRESSRKNAAKQPLHTRNLKRLETANQAFLEKPESTYKRHLGVRRRTFDGAGWYRHSSTMLALGAISPLEHRTTRIAAMAVTCDPLSRADPLRMSATRTSWRSQSFRETPAGMRGERFVSMQTSEKG